MENINKVENKYSYEDLEELLRKAIDENKQLKYAVSELSENRGIQRLDFLFKIIENSLQFTSNIVDKTVKEITDIMFPSEEVETSTNKE